MARLSLAVLTIMILAGCDAGQPNYQSTPLPTGPERPASSNDEGADDPDAQKEFTTTESGLKYKILRKGNDKKPTAADRVLAHYRGWLDDGTEFDSSYKRGSPTPFPLRGVIPGWTEGLQLIGEGGKIELEIPSELGYGAGGQGEIPPNATLHFIVELKEVQ